LLEEHLYEQIARVLRISPAIIDKRTPLGSLGLDSLTALELKNLLENSLDLSLPVTLAWNYHSVAALAIHLAERMQLPLEPAEPEAPAGLLPQEGAELAALLSDIDRLF